MKRKAKTDGATADMRAMRALAETMAAGKRIGDTPADNLAWLYDLTERDLGQTEAAEDSGWELAAFCSAIANRYTWQSVKKVGGALSPTREWPLLRGLPPDFTVDEVRRIQASLAEALRTLANPGELFRFPVRVFEGLRRIGRLRVNRGMRGALEIVTATARNPRETFSISPFADSLAATFWGAVAELFRELPSLRICGRPGCGRIYAPHRRWQEYCGHSCASRARQARYRKHNGGKVSDDRHERYVKKIREKHVNAKIARRPRRSREKGETSRG